MTLVDTENPTGIVAGEAKTLVFNGSYCFKLSEHADHPPDWYHALAGLYFDMAVDDRAVYIKIPGQHASQKFNQLKEACNRK